MFSASLENLEKYLAEGISRANETAISNAARVIASNYPQRM